MCWGGENGSIYLCVDLDLAPADGVGLDPVVVKRDHPRLQPVGAAQADEVVIVAFVPAALPDEPLYGFTPDAGLPLDFIQGAGK